MLRDGGIGSIEWFLECVHNYRCFFVEVRKKVLSEGKSGIYYVKYHDRNKNTYITPPVDLGMQLLSVINACAPQQADELVWRQKR